MVACSSVCARSNCASSSPTTSGGAAVFGFGEKTAPPPGTLLSDGADLGGKEPWVESGSPVPLLAALKRGLVSNPLTSTGYTATCASPNKLATFFKLSP